MVLYKTAKTVTHGKQHLQTRCYTASNAGLPDKMKQIKLPEPSSLSLDMRCWNGYHVKLKLADLGLNKLIED